MKSIAVLRVQEEATAFELLIRAASERDLKVGWLELDELPELDLVETAGLGLHRAVRVGTRGSLSVKPRKGPWRLRDVLREYFLGDALVLARGAVEAPLLRPREAAWSVESAAGSKLYSTEELLGRLCKPDPFPVP